MTGEDSRIYRLTPWLLLVAIVALLVLAMPGLVYVGLALLVLPGLLLWLAPPVCMYGAIVLPVWLGLERFPRLRLPALALVLGLVAIGPPWLANARLDRDMAALKQDDVALARPPALPDTVAFFVAHAPERGQKAKIECVEICLRLLFNGAVRRVIVAEALSGLDGPLPQDSLTAFRVEPRATCPKASFQPGPDWREYWPERAYAEETRRRAAKRIEQGACLIQETASVHDAQLLYLEREAEPEHLQTEWSPWATLWRVHRVELLAREGAKSTLLYRSTAIDSIRLMTPFLVGVTGLYYPVGANSGIFREHRFDNPPRIGQLAKALFGPAAEMPPPLTPEPKGGVDIRNSAQPGRRKLESP